jgi:hypothetical protein
MTLYFNCKLNILNRKWEKSYLVFYIIMQFCSLEFVWKKKTIYMGTSMMLSLDVYPRVLMFFMILPPALSGIAVRPTYLYPCIPLIFKFVENVIHYAILYQMFNIAETTVVFNRLKYILSFSVWILTCKQNFTSS